MPATSVIETITCDVLVIGGGVAGCCAAMAALKEGARVCLAVKGSFAHLGIRGSGASSCGNTEGGAPRLPDIPGVAYEPEDMYKKAVTAGLGLADRSLIQTLVDNAEETRRVLGEWGCSYPAVGPAALGYPIISAAAGKIRRSARLLEETMILHLFVEEGRCTGALGVDHTGKLSSIKAGAVIIAAGGNARLFSQNVHPSCCTGDGYALALKAGASLMNMEFMQIFTASVFPTRNLIHTWKVEQLQSLLNGEGKSFIESYLPAGVSRDDCFEENIRHAPFSTRDRASRYLGVGIVKEILAGRGSEHGGVYLDLRESAHLIPPRVRDFFAYKGLDLEKRPVEIGMAHQCSNGGIVVDNKAMTGIPGLFAAGEAITGTHGADRIGGNMLAQCSVFGRIAGIEAAGFGKSESHGRTERRGEDDVLENLSIRVERGAVGGVSFQEMSKIRDDLARISWSKGLVVKTEESLAEWNTFLDNAIDYWSEFRVLESREQIIPLMELKNLLLVGKAVCTAMTERRESRGPHYREDYPELGKTDSVSAINISLKSGALPREDTIIAKEKNIDPEWSDFHEISLGNQRWG